MDSSTALRERLLQYDRRYPGIPVPLPVLTLQVRYIDRIDSATRSWTLAEQLIAQDPAIEARSTQYHVLAPNGGVPTTLCLQHCPTPPHGIYQDAYYLVKALGPISFVELSKLLRSHDDYPFPGTEYHRWLLMRMCELFDDVAAQNGKLRLR